MLQLLRTSLPLLLVLVNCTCVRAQTAEASFDYFSVMKAPAAQLDFITKEGIQQPTTSALEQMRELLARGENLTEQPEGQLRIGNEMLPAETGSIILHQQNSTGTDWLTLLYLSDENDNPRSTMWQAVGTYSGTQYNNACFYLKLGGEQKSSLQATALIGNLIVSAGIEFPFTLPPWGQLPDAAQQAAFLAAAETLTRRVDLLKSQLVPQDRLIYATHPAQPLTAAERVFGLVQFWTEAKYNFAYFDQVPDLNWDAELQRFLPLVQEAADDVEYYRLLEQFCALLQDGHTNVYPPMHVNAAFDRPQLQIELVEGKPVVVNHSLKIGDKVPLGSTITSVEGLAVEAHLQANVFPYISIGSPQVKKRWGAHDLLKGPSGEDVTFQFITLEGDSRTLTLNRNRNSSDFAWAVPAPNRPLTEFKILEGGIGYLVLNSFGSNRAATEFLGYLPEIRNCKGLIIDLRNNGGGNSDVGYDILKYFTDQSLLTSSWRTREERAANRAWGKFVLKENPANLSEGDLINRNTYLGQNWHIAPPDTIQPAADPMPGLPVAVLVSNYTASAAEDFLVAADVLKTFTFVGEPSFGSTGQPLMFPLPGGGSARICTKRDTYPDGKVFVGPGVQVDIPVAQTIEDYLYQRDVVLDKALEVLAQN